MGPAQRKNPLFLAGIVQCFAGSTVEKIGTYVVPTYFRVPGFMGIP